ncbi:uncharacterized protein LOC114936129 isoform X2 [Nylanderia fulva]|uniref:uncharacterized protein LOC114936129 isoform X2 n=1 Tax=Nylanderia fulva TaxID=613905 RepID=UPI0010FB7F8E|nr:uncharacterized protein LOC114936129 isoform X2 [Nylanderia fulva]
MLKLIAISCVIVVASLNFQKVKGFNLVPSIPNVIKNPIPNIKNPIPNIIENPISNIIKNPIPNIIENPISNIINNPISKIIEDPLSNIIKNPIADIQNLIPNISSINPLKIGGNDISNIIKNISKLGGDSILGKILNARATCVRAFTEGYEIFTQLSSIFNTCVIKQIKKIPSPTANIKKLSNLASDVQEILTKDVHDTLQCLQQSPVNIVSCLNIPKHLYDPKLLSDVISEVLSIFPFNLIKYIPDMISCGEKLVVELINIPKLFKFLIDAGLCVHRVRSLI